MATIVKAVVTTKSTTIPVLKDIQLQSVKEDQIVVKVIAAGYYHLVRGRASEPLFCSEFRK